MQAVNLQPKDSEQLIFSRLVQNGFPDQFAKLVTAQSGHESDGWTSNVYLIDNNAFGYGYTGNGYTSYPDVESNVDDVSGYIKRKVTAGLFPDPAQITDPYQWASLLKSVDYYRDSETNYAAGIGRWFNDNLKTLAISSGLVILGLLLAYLLFRK